MPSITKIFKMIGPGIMAASAAIGTSHLVQCTRAGGYFGYELLWVVIIINILKYPFIEYGLRYTVGTHENILKGYYKLNPKYLIFYIIICLIATVGGLTAITYISAGILKTVIQSSYSIKTLSLFIAAGSILIISIGHYKYLDKIMKVFMVFLLISTCLALILAIGRENILEAHNYFYQETAWSKNHLPFILALMGWMPAPIEISSWYSLWLEERNKGSAPLSLKEAKIDFNLGYFLMIVTAVLFLILGALILYTSGEEISSRADLFAAQLIKAYTKTIGSWSGTIISILAAILSTMLTTADGYPRSLAKGLSILLEGRKKTKKYNEQKLQFIFMIVGFSMAFYLILFHVKNFKTLIDVVTITAFISAPFFSYMNYKVVNSHLLPQKYHPKVFLKSLSWIGIIYMVLFGIVFLYTLI